MAIRPMLALDANKVKVRLPMIGQPKLDGFRCLMTASGPQARSGDPFINRNLAALVKDQEWPIGLDGELCIGPPTDQACIQRTTSALNSHHGSLEGLTYNVYDLWDRPGLAFEYRMQILERMISDINLSTSIRLVSNEAILSYSDVDNFELRMLALGYEGIILRSPIATYHHNRAGTRFQQLLKIKRFLDAEAICIGMEELQHNDNEAETDELGRMYRSSAASGQRPSGLMGKLVLDWQGQRLAVGSGFTVAQRREFFMNPPLRQWVKFKYQPHGVKDLPRSPIYRCLRHKSDMS